jgi:hypothetical protein
LSVTLALLVAACERVTAPKALEIVDNLERKLESGGLMSIQNYLEMTQNAGVSLFDFHGRSLLGVMRDGSMEQLNAVVVERVYLPPDSGGTAIVRRTLFAWPDSAQFAIVALSELHPGDVGTSQYFDPNERLSPPAVLTVHFPKKEDLWIPRSGVVDIAAVAPEGSCPLRVTQYDYPRPDPISCELASFAVQIHGDLVREADTHSALLASLVKRHQVLITSQRVHGVRFTVDCSKAKPIEKGGTLRCFDNLGFWRADSLFAKSLGVDVSRTKNKPGTSLYYRQIRPGHGTSADGDWVLRWTVSAPNGRTIVRDSITHQRVLPQLPPYDFLLWETGVGGRRQYILAADEILPSAKPTEIVVVDVEWMKR